MANRKCEACKEPFEAVSPRARFCREPVCRRARARNRKRKQLGVVIPIGSDGPQSVLTHPLPSRGGVVAAIRADLEEAGRIDSVAGQVALSLAEQLDDPLTRDTGSSRAALAKQLLATMDEAMKDARRAASPLDEIRARRMARLQARG